MHTATFCFDQGPILPIYLAIGTTLPRIRIHTRSKAAIRLLLNSLVSVLAMITEGSSWIQVIGLRCCEKKGCIRIAFLGSVLSFGRVNGHVTLLRMHLRVACLFMWGGLVWVKRAEENVMWTLLLQLDLGCRVEIVQVVSCGILSSLLCYKDSFCLCFVMFLVIFLFFPLSCIVDSLWISCFPIPLYIHVLFYRSSQLSLTKAKFTIKTRALSSFHSLTTDRIHQWTT